MTGALCSATSARRTRARPSISASQPREVRRGRPDVRAPARAARRVDDRPRRRHRRSGAGGTYDAAEVQRGTASRRVRTWSEPREVDRPTRRASSATGSRCRTTYRRSLVDLAALRFSPPVAGGRSLAGRRAAVVHDDVRTRQHLHQPAGAAVHARARGDDAARARRLAGHAGSTTSATRIPAGSCTRCATAR